VFVPVLCCGDDAICFLRPIFGCLAGQAAEARIIRDAFSPIMIDGALVLPQVRLGMIDRVGHTQTLDAAHSQLVVNDRHRVCAVTRGIGSCVFLGPGGKIWWRLAETRRLPSGRR
jgi:hypothetical protein